MYVQSLKSIYGDHNDNVIDTQIEVDFPRWFQEYVSTYLDYSILFGLKQRCTNSLT